MHLQPQICLHSDVPIPRTEEATCLRGRRAGLKLLQGVLQVRQQPCQRVGSAGLGILPEATRAQRSTVVCCCTASLTLGCSWLLHELHSRNAWLNKKQASIVQHGQCA